MPNYNPIVPKQDRKYCSPVRYYITWTDLFLSLSNVHAEVVKAFESMWSAEELARNVIRYNDDGLFRAAGRFFLSISHLRDGGRLELSFSRTRAPYARHESVELRKVEGRWQLEGVPHLRLRRYLNEIAKRSNWDRAVFADKEGLPTLEPWFTFLQGERTFTVTAPLVAMSEIDFRRTYKLGAPLKWK